MLDHDETELSTAIAPAYLLTGDRANAAWLTVGSATAERRTDEDQMAGMPGVEIQARGEQVVIDPLEDARAHRPIRPLDNAMR